MTIEQSKILPLELTGNSDALTWKQWKRRVEIYLTAKDISNAKRRHAILLHLGGPQLLAIYDSLPNVAAIEAEQDAYVAAITALDTYFEPKTNDIYERFVFRQIMQGTDLLQQFVTKLRTQPNDVFLQMRTNP